MIRTAKALATMMAVSTFLMCASSGALAASDAYVVCKPIRDLIQQHRCLMKQAIAIGDADRIEQLAKTGYITVNGPSESKNNETYLFLAVSYHTQGNKRGLKGASVIRALFGIGADPNQQPYAFVPLVGSTAFSNNRARLIADAFLEYGQDTDIEITNSRFPANDSNLLGLVSRLCWNDPQANPSRQRLVGKLLDANADPNWESAMGITALHLIAGRPRSSQVGQCDEIVRLLVKGGADMSARDSSGLTPVDYTLIGPRVVERRGDRHMCTTIPAKFYKWSGQVQSQAAIRQVLLDRGSPAPTVTGDNFPCPILLSW